MGYTVDEVSEVLEIPRPTLYRYLREYSIPHQRRAGKISIPEESLERIREARELHGEGLGTASVRKRIRKTYPSPDTERLAERLDRICGALESLQDDLRPADGASTRMLREILEGQRSLALAVHRLSERVEDVLAANGSSGGASYSAEPEEHTHGKRTLIERPRVRPIVTETRQDTPGSGTSPTLGESPGTRTRSKQKFGDMSRKRRQSGALALLLALLLGGVLIWGLARWDYSGEEGAQANSSEQASSDEPEAGNQEQPLTTAEAFEAAKVPNLAGLSFPQATEQLAQAGLEPGSRAEVESADTLAGTVIAQYPASGETVDPGSGVNLLFSSGPPMPDMSSNEPIPPAPEGPDDAAGDGSDSLPYQGDPYQDEGIPPAPF